MQDVNYGHKVVGKPYLELLSDIHRSMNPATYFEIGVNTGLSIKRASCATIGVDPHFLCDSNFIGHKPVCHLYQKTSDDFFRDHNPSQIFGRPVDFAFLDGLHWFDALLRDFINTEKHCTANSVIAMHDCLPPGFIMTSRNFSDTARSDIPEAYRGAWTGDVWKIVPTLQKYRPDLSVIVADSTPTGLVLVTNLDPENSLLSENYDKILSSFKDMDRNEYDNYWRKVKITLDMNVLRELAAVRKA